MENNQEQLKKLGRIFNSDKIVTNDDLVAVLKGVLEIMNSFKKDNQTLSAETKKEVTDLLAQVEEYRAKAVNDLSTEKKSMVGEFERNIALLKGLIAKVKTIKPKDGVDGMDGINANPEDVVSLVLAQIKLPEQKETILDGRKEIVEKINTGKKKDLKIEIAQIEMGTFEKGILDRAVSILDQRTKFLINKGVKHDSTLSGDGSDANPLSVIGGGGSGTVGPGTTNEIAYFNSATTVASLTTATYPSLTELSYVKGVTSAIQTQLGTMALAATTITIAGTASQITSSAGAQSLAANRTWTLSFPSDVLIPTVLTVPNTGLHLLDTNASHDLIIKPGSDITADRTLTLTTGDTDMIVNLTAVTDEYVLAYDTGTNTWRGVVASAGSGDVVGPSSSTDNAIVRFDSTTGKLIQNYTSNAPTISDTGAVTIAPATNLTVLTLTGGTSTASAPIIAGTQTWNNAAVTFIGETRTYTETAKATASVYHKILGGSSGTTVIFSVEKANSATGAGVGIGMAPVASGYTGGTLWVGGGSGPVIALMPGGLKGWGFRASAVANNDLALYQGTSADTDPITGTPKMYFGVSGGVNIGGTTDTAAGALQLTGKVLTYNNIATVSNGIPSELATVDLTGQTAAKTATTLYTPTASGMYRISVVLHVTTVASVSSILGGTTGVVLAYTEPDGSVAQTNFVVAMDDQTGAVIVTGNGNTTNTTQATSQGTAVIYAKTGVAITYAIGYTSVNAAEMQYSAHLKVEFLG